MKLSIDAPFVCDAKIDSSRTLVLKRHTDRCKVSRADGKTRGGTNLTGGKMQNLAGALVRREIRGGSSYRGEI